MSARFEKLFVAAFCFAVLFSASGEIRGKRIVQKNNSAEKISPASTNSSAITPTKPTTANGYLNIGFDKLADYTFTVPEGVQTNAEQNAKTSAQIPAAVKAFDQQKVAVKGFMLPLKVDDGVVTEMLIMKDQSMCCYGAVPRINDWVSVKMKKGGVKSIMDQPVTLYGKLHVGEMLENGYLVGIYELDGEKMDEPKE